MYNKNNIGLKAAATLGFLFGAGATAVAYIIKKKNDEYREALIDMSDIMPGAPDEQTRRDNWRSSHSPENRKSVEERLEDQRIKEE